MDGWMDGLINERAREIVVGGGARLEVDMAAWVDGWMVGWGGVGRRVGGRGGYGTMTTMTAKT